MFSIRRATISDIDDRDGEEPSSQLLEATRSYLLQSLPTEHFLVWVAETEEEIIGMNGLVFFEKPPTSKNSSGREAYIMNMYTVHHWRGKGVATSLVQEIIRRVKQTDAKRLSLITTPSGQHVYEACGFLVTADDMELVW